MKILIVEDEVIPAHYLKKILMKEGYEVVGIAKQGKDAITLAKSEKPDIIFMDLQKLFINSFRETRRISTV